MRAVLIMNPVSGISTLATSDGTAEEHEQAVLAALRLHGIEAKVMYTTPEDPGARLAAQAAAEQAEVVIAAGGDGTIHEVATGLIGTQSALGILPLGTMNNLAHSLNIPETIEEACAAIATGETVSIDVGKINEQYFLEVAGIGLEAALFPAAEEVKSPGVLSTLHGIIEGLCILLAYKPARLRISIDEQKRHPYHAIQVTICNSRYYGPQFELVPDALMDDGLLDVVIFKNFNKLEYMRHAISIVQGKRLYQPKVIHRRVKSLRINADHPMEIQADGLPHGHTPATVTVLPGALRVRVPVGAQLASAPANGPRAEASSPTAGGGKLPRSSSTPLPPLRTRGGTPHKPHDKRAKLHPYRKALSMSDNTPQSANEAGSKAAGSPTLPITPPEIATIVEQNVKPVVTEAQRIAAETSVSGRHAVSRGMILLATYIWLLSGAVMFSFIARYTQFFPGDRSITSALQRQQYPWIRRFMMAISEIGFPRISIPLTLTVSGIFLALRFRLEAIFILLTTSSSLLNALVKRLIKRPRPTAELVTVVRVINEPSFPSGHVMHYTNFYGLLIYLLATNWRSGKLRNILIAICTALIILIGPSRVYLGAHWPSDVMAGYLYGGLWFGGLMALYLRIKAWIHPAIGKTPEVMKLLEQPGEQE